MIDLASMKAKIKTVIRHIRFEFDYVVGRYLTNAYQFDCHREYMFKTYPEFYENELKYMEEKHAA